MGGFDPEALNRAGEPMIVSCGCWSGVWWGFELYFPKDKCPDCGQPFTWKPAHGNFVKIV